MKKNISFTYRHYQLKAEVMNNTKPHANHAEFKSQRFGLTAGKLLIDSETDSQTEYSPTDETSTIITNSTFSSNITGWTSAGTVTPSPVIYDSGNGGRAEIILEDNASFFSEFYQDYASVENYAGQTLTFSFEINKGTLADGDFDVALEASVDGGSTFFKIAKKRFLPGDISGTETIEISLFVREDLTDLRYGIFFPVQVVSAGNQQVFYLQDVSVDVYDQVQTTLNSEGLNIFKSPINKVIMNANKSEFLGGTIRVDELMIPNLESSALMATPPEGKVNLAITNDTILTAKRADGTVVTVALS